MHMKRILIWDKGLPLANTGGPAGYLWNLKAYLDTCATDSKIQICFYSDTITERPIKISIFDRCINYIFRKLGFNTLASLYSMYFAHSELSDIEIDQIKSYDFVHIHSLPFILRYGLQLKKHGIRIIYTTHTPELMVDEVVYNSYQQMSQIERKLICRKKFVNRELFAYKLADYIMFPVKGVEECYTGKSESMKRYFSSTSKIFYVPTAILDSHPEPSAQKILAQYNIPSNAKIICYVGRHTTVKGYEYLKQIANKIFKKRNDVYFVIGGSKGLSEPLKHSHWIELGWVNTHQLLKEVDVFILPNQQTYFDIIALEVMRAGVPLITTPTGGNKYLENINNDGITFIPKSDVERAVEHIEMTIESDLKQKGFKCRSLYLDNFTFKQYLDNYSHQVNLLKG